MGRKQNAAQSPQAAENIDISATLGEFGVTMKVAAQRRRDESRRAIADRAAVDRNDGNDDLARRGDEGLARAIGLFAREGALFERAALRFYDHKHDRTRD